MELDFTILGRQRDEINRLIKDGKLYEAHAALLLISELWFKYNYGFMYTELRKKVKQLLDVIERR